MSLEEIIKKILENHDFLRLKTVVENNPYHDHEDVYTHSIKTMEKAQELINGSFIEDERARGMFLEYVGQSVDGIKRADLMVLIALLHDVGKAYVPITQTDDGTRCVGHEQKGSEVVGLLIEDLGFTNKQLDFIKKVIRLHDTYNASNLSKGLTVEQIKQMGEGVHIEILFNRYCDCFYAKPFQESLSITRDIFDKPELYL